MRNLKAIIEYDGSDYCGWQVQNRVQRTEHREQKKSIQATIEKILQKILQEKIRLIASGRTDAGVHALGQVANFKTRNKIPLDKLKRALNSLLPDDIRVSRLEEAGADFHSRYNAKFKIYRYLILNQPDQSPFLQRQVYFCPYALDVGLMAKAAKRLKGRRDFKSFCASGSKVKSTVRTIKNLTVKRVRCGYPDPGRALIEICIEADGFLYNMVRNIVGTLIEIGRGRFKPPELTKIALAKNRTFAGPTAPASGLCLMQVKY